MNRTALAWAKPKTTGSGPWPKRRPYLIDTHRIILFSELVAGI